MVDSVTATTGGKPACIELRLRKLEQLFESLDPAPFHEQDLDRDAEDYIVSWAREYHATTPLVLRLHLPADQAGLDPERTVQKALVHHFTYRADLARLEVRRTLQQGRTSLLVGVMFLALCMLARELIVNLPIGGTRVAQEGMLIVGWVAMWRPLELLLYDWWPLLRLRRTFANLARTRVEVVFQ